MKQYLIAFNNLQGFDANKIHQVVTTTPQIDDWWHYLPSIYLISSNSTAKTIADYIIRYLPGLLFFVLEVDYKQYNGVLNKDAWEWISKKKRIPLRVKPVNTTPANPFDGFFAPRPTTTNRPLTLEELFRKSSGK
jgi:hypothetical protein